MHSAQRTGREDRWDEPAHTTAEEVVADLLPGLVTLADRPTVLFGHSLGATIAYEAARVVGDRVGHLVVSGEEAPHRRRQSDFRTAADAVLIAEITRLRGERRTSCDDYLLSMLRADYAVHETCRPDPHREPLACPVTVLVGTDDREVTSAHAHAWSRCTTAAFRAVFAPGDHFHVFETPAAAVRAVVDAAMSLLEGPP